MKKLIIAFIILICSFNSYSSNANWELVAVGNDTNNTGFRYYVDFSDVSRSDKFVYYWQLEDYPARDKHGDKSNKMLWELQCNIPIKQRYLTWLYYTENMANGKVSIVGKESEKWIYLPKKGSVMSTIMKKVCSLNF